MSKVQAPAHVHAECCDERAFHPQVRIEHDERVALVDEEMAPFVKELWRVGITTISSCQDCGESLADLADRLPHAAEMVRASQGRALLDVAPPDALDVLERVAEGSPRPALYERMTCWTAPGAWSCRLIVLDLLDDGDLLCFQVMAVQIELPRSDLEQVAACVQRAHRAAWRASVARPVPGPPGRP